MEKTNNTKKVKPEITTKKTVPKKESLQPKPETTPTKNSIDKAQEYHKLINQTREEIRHIVVGQDKVITGLFRGLLCNSHVLIEGIPGIAKTLLIRALAKVTGGKFSRVQFTVDLLPTDIVGITTYTEQKGFYTVKGPIFANFVLADEINRSPPKTQSAMLEAMQERQATIGKDTYAMPEPFFVMATQNPLEQEGVYKLPEAQIDRFLFKVLMHYPKIDEEQIILKQNLTTRSFEEFEVQTILSPLKIMEMQEYVKNIYVSPEVERYILRIVEATRYSDRYNLKLGKYINWGGSPRASIGLYIGSKAEALLQGKDFVTPQHVKNVAHDVLRHRLILGYEAEAEKITADDVIKEILSKVPAP
ncbi:MAG: MoxR family ATPase [archaeon]